MGQKRRKNNKVDCLGEETEKNVKENTNYTSRKTYIDFLRIIAIAMVLFNHTAYTGYTLFEEKQQSPFYMFYICNSIYIKCAVPLFLMASGALLLHKNESYSDVLKRFFKFLFLLIAASFIDYLYKCFYLQSMAFSVREFFTLIYSKPICTALWYLYAYLAFILMLPFMRVLAQNMDDRAFYWMFGLNLLINIVPILEELGTQGQLRINSNFTFFISKQFFFYPLIGYYIDRRIRKEQLKFGKAFLLLVIGAASVVLCAYLTHWKCTYTGTWNGDKFETFFNRLIFLPATATFYAARYLFEKFPLGPISSRIVSAIGSATFGVFLLEEICRLTTKPVFDHMNLHIPTICACWLWVLSACTMGIVITLILKKLPLVSKVL